jgi:hypothetical protein
MFRRKPAPDLIRGGRRFADKNMRQRKNRRRAPDDKQQKARPHGRAFCIPGLTRRKLQIISN